MKLLVHALEVLIVLQDPAIQHSAGSPANNSQLQAEAPASSEFLSLLRISEFFGFQWQNLTEILRLLPKVLQSENEAVIMITSPLYNICLQQM